MKPNLPLGVKIITERLEENGKRAHIVGGCVRDFLLSKIPYDYDITTDALPREMKEIFSDMKTVDTGIKHGTLTVICEGEPYEVTTYRLDGEYEDHRHPTSVEFTSSLTLDLSRRDFTMNAICYSERDGFVDAFSGVEDIKRGIIRAVGEPARRFTEDALRILRAIRFSSVLDFEIEPETATSAVEKAHLLSSVSGERIYTEWKKLICGQAAYRVLSTYGDIVSEFLFSEPLILPDRERFSCASPMARQISLFALSTADPVERFTDFCDRMRTDSITKKLGVSALRNINANLSDGVYARLLTIEVGIEAAELIAETKNLIGENALTPSGMRAACEGYPISLSELSVGGEDMKKLGFSGKAIGDSLHKLLIMCARDEVKNERSSLIFAAENFR